MQADNSSAGRIQLAAAPEQTDSPDLTWDGVVRSQASRVYRLAYRLTGNVHDAEDLTQETFIRVFRSLDGFQPGSLDGWVHRITVNLYLDQMRHQARLRMGTLGDEAEWLADPIGGPENLLDWSQLDSDVEQALAALPPDFRVAVVLCDIEGYSYDEIAEATGVRAGTVASRIHRGRCLLRASLAHRDPRLNHQSSSQPSGGQLTMKGEVV